MKPLTSTIRPYAWGSRTALAALQGRPVPSAGPEAELWLGAHPSAPSVLPVGSLERAIRQDPVGLLGAEVSGRFGPRLPYLLKILAAAHPLSLQAHPNAEQAAAGYAAERAQGVAPADCNYVDPYHKPEIVVAFGGFDALCGFRDPETSARALAGLGVPALDPVVHALRTGSVSERLRAATESLLGWPADQRAELVAAVAAADPLAAELAREYPGDIGVVVALLLNRVELEPDEAIFMPAGNLHAYLKGVGVEVMAASDNVVRAGLTPKRVDLAELVRLLRFEVLEDPVVRPVPVGHGVLTWPVDVQEFVLRKAVAEAAPVRLPGTGPRIVVCVRGAGLLFAGDDTRPIRSGEAVFLADHEPPLTISGGLGHHARDDDLVGAVAHAGIVVFQASTG